MIVNKCSEILLAKSKKLYGNYRDNCTVVQRMLEKYKKLYPNISDYSIMHFIDIAEFCDMIMDKRKLENLNEDECYCLLSAALFAHIGFGLNQEIMNRYVDKLGIQKQAEELTFFQVMSKYHVLFSACLLEEYGDIFEFPSDLHKYAIIRMLHFIGENGTAPVQLEEALVLNNQNVIRLKELAAVLAVGNQLAELKNANIDLSYDKFDKYNSEEIVGFVERNVVRSIKVKDGKLVIEAGGSDSAYTLIERKVNLIIDNFGKIVSSLSDRSDYSLNLFSIVSIELHRLPSAETKCHTTTAGTEDTCDLWNQSGCQSLFHINFTECFQCVSCLLKTETCTIDQADHRSTGLHSHIIKSGNLLGMHFTNGSVQYGNILAVHIHQISIDYTISGNNTV